MKAVASLGSVLKRFWVVTTVIVMVAVMALVVMVMIRTMSWC